MTFDKLQIVFRKDLFCLLISGKDRVDFLNRLTSQRIVFAKPGEVLPAAFLKANGTPVALFHLWIREQDIVLIGKHVLEAQILKFIDDFHFGEDLKVEKWKGIYVYEIRQKKLFTPKDFTILPLEPWSIKAGIVERAYVLSEHDFDTVAEGLGAIKVSDEENFMHRAYAGVPEHPEEFSDSNIILEGPFDVYVHRNKGCYPGQEVVERIYTYGNVAKKIMTFKISDKISDFESLRCAEIYAEGKVVGNILSLCNTVNGVLGFAIVKRLALEKNLRLEALDSTSSYLIFSLSTE